MRPLHPWLARVAWVGIGLGLLAGLAALGLAVLPMDPPWYGERVTQRWQGVTTAGQGWWAARQQFDELAPVAVGPLGWVLVAGVLRLTAVGRLRWAGRPHPLVRLLRWPAVAAAAVALLSGLSAARRWVDPVTGPGNEYHLTTRLEQAVADGRRYHFDLEPQPGGAGASAGYSRAGPTTDPTEARRRWVAAVSGEVYWLFYSTRQPGLLLLACGIVYCLASARPDSEDS